ncbi:epoxide hydrolase [Aspergillus heteromorphus CBS 117.55]|uniref:Epoxide hydrolase n=1 Tax=Aspergillus heteromorphus CBS 117.55 TaxID=1448321 RepID=A0A317V478_9EURO|nr:epoxide hydrolase [Aspergillus heteromorphus CBS 117.55]PWY67878.1 epoxide hydrolase [Aspergillus heteromorphus CBS 117.55]
MASIAFPSLAKKATLSDGTTYGYVAIPAVSADKSTFVLIHGYPSTSYDWRLQITALQKEGHGVIVPDLLGYGDTDKPLDLKAYRLKTMSSQVVEIMDIEKVSRAVLVGHDWGVALASRMALFYPERFYGLVTVAVSYTEPSAGFSIDAICELTQKLVGYETYGYWKWHNSEEAAAEMEAHPASAFNLIYPHDPLLFKTDLGPTGKAAEFVRSGRTTPLPSWLTQEDYEMHDRIFSKGGYTGPLSWYKAAMRGMNSEDEAGLTAEQKVCPVRNLFVAATQDYVCRADLQIKRQEMTGCVPNGRVELVDCGHWVQLEKPEVLNELILGFAKEVVN